MISLYPTSRLSYAQIRACVCGYLWCLYVNDIIKQIDRVVTIPHRSLTAMKITVLSAALLSLLFEKQNRACFSLPVIVSASVWGLSLSLEGKLDSTITLTGGSAFGLWIKTVIFYLMRKRLGQTNTHLIGMILGSYTAYRVSYLLA